MGEVKRTLYTLPKTLDDTYESILLGILLEYQKGAIAALIWLVFAKRPLTIVELAKASVIEITSTTSSHFNVSQRLITTANIVSTLSALCH
jgi:hypothetical protein